jgi:hypothetical protein
MNPRLFSPPWTPKNLSRKHNSNQSIGTSDHDYEADIFNCL